MLKNKAIKEFSSVYRELFRNINNDVQMQFFWEREDFLSATKEHEDFNKQMHQELKKITTRSFEKCTEGMNLTEGQSEYYLKGLIKEYNSQLAKYGNEASLRIDKANFPSTKLSEQTENQPAKNSQLEKGI